MSAEDWLRAAKAEERRLLAEIAKTNLYRQLEAVRGVLAAYEVASERGSESTRVWKIAS
jgi:hypothetical protein